MILNKSFLIFYTVELDDFRTVDKAPNAFFQTIYSIYSIRKLWGDDDEIRIYTNLPDKFKKVLDYKNLNIIKPDESEFTYSGDYGKKYGHARIFLLDKLVNEESRYILYLDPDTGLRKNADKYMHDKLFEKTKIHLYRPEIYNDFVFWFEQKTLNDIWKDFKQYYKIPYDAVVINNGVILVPNNSKNREEIHKLKEFYLDLYNNLRVLLIKNKMNMSEIFFTDMWACTVAYYRLGWKTLYPANFYNIKVKNGYIPGDDPSIPIIHYYNIKNETEDAYWKKVKDKMIKKFSNIIF